MLHVCEDRWRSKVAILGIAFFAAAVNGCMQVVSGADVLVQLDYIPGWLRGEPVAITEPFGRMPRFTLFSDGVVIYLADQIMSANLTASDALALRDHIVSLGFPSLPNHFETPSRDAGTTILRVRLSSGELREVRYVVHSNPREVSDSIGEYLDAYSHPDALPYVPENATLVITTSEARPIKPEYIAKIPLWPLSAQQLERPTPGATEWGFVITASQYQLLVQTFRPFWQLVSFRVGDRIRLALVRPWLPGEDFSDRASTYVLEANR